MNAREEVSQETIEHNPVIADNLLHVEVAQRAEQQCQFRDLLGNR